MSKYRLTLRATLLVWPRTSPLIISHGLSIRSSSSLLVFPFPSTPPRDASFVLSASREADTGEPPASIFPTSRLPGFTPSPSSPDGTKIWSTLASPRLKVIACTLPATRSVATIGNSFGSVTPPEPFQKNGMTSGKIVAILGNIVSRYARGTE